jgi:adenylate cyclase
MAAEQIDFDAEGLLDGLQGEQRAERLALLEYLAGDGVPLAQLRRSTTLGTLMFLPAERVIGGQARYTAAEIAERSGVSEEFLLAVLRAMGLPIRDEDEAVYTESDLEVVRLTNVFRAAGITDEEILDLLRALGRGLSQAAETMRALPLRIMLEPDLSEHALAQRYASITSELAPLLTPLIGGLLNLHLRQMAQSEAISEAERRGGQLPGLRRWPSPLPIWSASPGLARRWRPRNSVIWPYAWRGSLQMSWSSRSGSSRRSAMRPCSPHPSPSRCSRRL